MNILALEFSSPAVSVALLADGALLGHLTWQEKRAAGQPLFDRVPRLMGEHHLSFGDLDYIAVGRGPGNYSGLRVSLAAAQALVLPNDAKVYAVSSGEALAQAAGEQTEAPLLAVVGDARRQSCWYGLFTRTGDRMEMLEPWCLCPETELASRLPASACLVSPEYSRLALRPGIDTEKTLQWLPGDHFPSAAFVARCAWERIESGRPSEPPHPLYMHPAVTVKS